MSTILQPIQVNVVTVGPSSQIALITVSKVLAVFYQLNTSDSKTGLAYHHDTEIQLLFDPVMIL